MIEQITDNIPAIITALATIGFVRMYMKRMMMLSEKVVDLQATILEAMKDDKLTKEELDVIVKKAKDVHGAVNRCIEPIKKLWNKIMRRQNAIPKI
jgi:hypothetical protein